MRGNQWDAESMRLAQGGVVGTLNSGPKARPPASYCDQT